MLKRVLFLLLFPIFFLKGVLIEPVPDWVKPCEYPLDAPLKPLQIHEQQLLLDRQHHWEKETVYLHRAIKMVDEVGAKEFSRLSCCYDPSYQKIIFHTLRLRRNGEWTDRLENSRHEVLQQEDRLDQDIYTGDFTLVYFLDDVRAGDIIEYALSFVGAHPASGPYHDGFIYLQDHQPFEKMHYRILSPQNQPLFIKPFYTSKKPTIQEIDSNLVEWIWEVKNTTPHKQENNEPLWYNPLERVQLTQYKSWEEVALQDLRLYPTLSDFKADEEMTALVHEWQNLAQTPEEQALLAIRFVQDQVHYRGFTEGMRGMKPSTPDLVFKQRSGDCKDKAVLLQALLHLMGISSQPTLVSSSKKKTTNDFLPTFSTLFDHVILRIQIDNRTHWVDATCTLQGGSLSENYCPDYGWGLVISEETQELTPIPISHLQNPTTLFTTVRLTSMDTAEVSSSFTYYGTKADARRNELKHLGEKAFSESYFELIPRKATEPLLLSISDHREQNVFSFTLSYQLPTKKRYGKKILPIHSYALKGGLDRGLKSDRKAPYDLHPLWIKEHIHVENPFNTWNVEMDEVKEEHASFSYRSALKKEGNTTDYDFEIHHLQDHVPAELAQNYYDIIQRIASPDPLEIR